MHDHFAGVHAKLSRADTHLKELLQLVPAYFHRDPYSFRDELDCDAGTYSLYVTIREQPPIGWSVILGDVVHNLRSALDHLAWQLVLLGGGTPSKRTQFPIFLTEPSSGRVRLIWESMVSGMSPEVIDCVRQMQPFVHGDKAGKTGLAVLNQLSNTDKHQLPAVCVSAVARHKPGEIGLVEVRDVQIGDPMIGVDRPLKDGDKVAWADICPTGPHPMVTLRGSLPMHVAFQAGTNHVPMQGLIDIYEHICTVVGRFIALCRETGLIQSVAENN